jgi:hypothetical protein
MSSGVAFRGCSTDMESPSSSMGSSWPGVLSFSGICAGGGISDGICRGEVASGAGALSCSDVEAAASGAS